MGILVGRKSQFCREEQGDPFFPCSRTPLGQPAHHFSAAAPLPLLPTSSPHLQVQLLLSLASSCFLLTKLASVTLLALGSSFLKPYSNLLQPRNFARPRPFSLQRFLQDQPSPTIMADNEKKARLSGESPRATEAAPALPTHTVISEKTEPPKQTIPSFVYVM